MEQTFIWGIAPNTASDAAHHIIAAVSDGTFVDYWHDDHFTAVLARVSADKAAWAIDELLFHCGFHDAGFGVRVPLTMLDEMAKLRRHPTIATAH